MRDWAGMMEDVSRGLTPTMPQFQSGWLVGAALVSGLLTWLTASFLQSFRLTLYAAVYRHLGGQGVPVDPEPPADASSPAPFLAVPGPPEAIGAAQPPAGLAEITVPDEATEPVEAPVDAIIPHV